MVVIQAETVKAVAKDIRKPRFPSFSQVLACDHLTALPSSKLNQLNLYLFKVHIYPLPMLPFVSRAL